MSPLAVGGMGTKSGEASSERGGLSVAGGCGLMGTGIGREERREFERGCTVM